MHDLNHYGSLSAPFHEDESSIRDVVDNAILPASTTHGKIQKFVYVALYNKLYSSNLSQLMHRRSLKYLPANLENDLRRIDWASVFSVAEIPFDASCLKVNLLLA